MSRNRDRSALSIYVRGYRRASGSSAERQAERLPNARVYFIRLRKTVLNELEQQGFCEFIDLLLEKKPDLDIISYATLADIQNIYAGGEPFHANNTIYVPWVSFGMNQQLVWDSLPEENYVYNYESYRNLLQLVKSEGHKVHLSFLQSLNSSKKSSVRANLTDEALKSAERIMTDSHEMAVKVLKTAMAQASDIINEANYDASRIRDYAEEQARQILAQAVSDARQTGTPVDLADEQAVCRHVLPQTQIASESPCIESHEDNRTEEKNIISSESDEKDGPDARLTELFNELMQSLDITTNAE